MNKEKDTNQQPVIIDESLKNAFNQYEGEVNMSTTRLDQLKVEEKRLEQNVKDLDGPDIQKMRANMQSEVARAEARMKEAKAQLNDISNKIKKIINEANGRPVIWREYQNDGMVYRHGGYSTLIFYVENGDVKMRVEHTRFEEFK